MRPHFLHKTDLRKTAQVLPGKRKNLWLPIWFPRGRFRSGFARSCQKVVKFSC